MFVDWLPNIWKQSHCRPFIAGCWDDWPCLCLVPCREVFFLKVQCCKQDKQIEDDAPEPKRTEHASLVCQQSCSIYICLLFVVYGHRHNCRHPKIYLNLYIDIYSQLTFSTAGKHIFTWFSEAWRSWCLSITRDWLSAAGDGLVEICIPGSKGMASMVYLPRFTMKIEQM